MKEKKEHLLSNQEDKSRIYSFLQKLQILLFYSVILFLPIQLGKHFWPSFSFVLGARVDYLSPTLYLTDVLIIFLACSVILQKFLSSKNAFRVILRVAKNLYKILQSLRSFRMTFVAAQFPILIILCVIISVLSPAPLLSFYILAKLFEMIFLGWYIAHVKKEQIKTIPFLLVVGVLFESLLVFFQFVHQGSVGGLLYWFGERTFTGQTPGVANVSLDGNLILRPYGTFPHPNVLAGYLTIAMTIVISNFPARNATHSVAGGQFSFFNKHKVTYLIALALGTLALLLTMSRVAIILWGLLLAHVIIRGLHNSIVQRSYKFSISNFKFLIKVSNFKFQIGIISLLLLVGILFFTSPLHYRFFSSLTDESILEREVLTESSIGMIQTHPIFGVGLGQFLHFLPSYYPTAKSLNYLQPVHNIFLLVLVETGIIGFAFFLWFLMKTCKRILIYDLRFKKKTFLSRYSLFVILTFVLVLGLFDHYFLTLQQGQLLISLVLGLCWRKNS